MHHAAVTDRCKHERNRELMSQHSRAQIDFRKSYRLPRTKQDRFKGAAILAQRDFAVSPAVKIIEHHLGHTPLGDATQVSYVHDARRRKVHEVSPITSANYFPAARFNSTSKMICTSSPATVGAPLTPKSRRLIFVVASAPMRTPPIAFTAGDGPSTSSTTSLVTPWIVRSPVTFNLPWLSTSAFLDLKVMVGYFATSKK